MRKHPAWLMLVVSLFAFVVVVATGCQEPRQEAPGGPQSPTGPSGVQRWDAMTDTQREDACEAVAGPLPGEGEVGGSETGGSPSDGVDYRKVLWVLQDAGYTQNEAAAMIPHALRECR